jgi:hypothetical protein
MHPFFNQVRDSYNFQVPLIHSNSGVESYGFVSLGNLDILVVEGSIWPPMKIELNAAGALDFDQTTWFEDEVGF